MDAERHPFLASPFLAAAGLDCFSPESQDSPHPGFVLAYSRILKDNTCCRAAALRAQGDTRRHASPTYAP
jgi:hypothetical protein